MTKLRHRFRGQRSNASPFRSRDCGTSSPFQIYPGCGSTDHPSRITIHSLRAKQRDPESVRGFTLVELLVVVGIIGLLLVLMAPAFTYIKGGTDVTSAAYTLKGVLDTARTYAKANNTYTWVGFFEEDASQPASSPARGGNGRIVMSIVASKDGT
ncbi:MAG TPA: type II secretion system protein, partial [Candidatus Udaeobacter sp.]